MGSFSNCSGQEIVPGYTVQGNPTIGYGRDMITEGISKDQATVLLRHDMDRVLRPAINQVSCPELFEAETTEGQNAEIPKDAWENLSKTRGFGA